jgi:hypothetical protein
LIRRDVKINIINFLVSKENGKLRGQYKILENLKSDLEKKMHERHDEYSKIVEDEKQKKADLLNGF